MDAKPPSADSVASSCDPKQCYRIQWTCEVKPRFGKKTTLASIGDEQSEEFFFDGFLLICHTVYSAIPDLEYTRSGVKCKIQFLQEDFPNALFEPEYASSLCIFQQHFFETILRIQPAHMFRFCGTSSDNTAVCGDFHLFPRFISSNCANFDQVESDQIGFAEGNLMPISKIAQILNNGSKDGVFAKLCKKPCSERELDILLDSIIAIFVPIIPKVDDSLPQTSPSTILTAYRVDAVEIPEANNMRSARLKHINVGCRWDDGIENRSRIAKWEEEGVLISRKPNIVAEELSFSIMDSYLTNIRTDMTELGSALPMVLKYVRHCQSLYIFERHMGICLTNKRLLIQAFTHRSFIDTDMASLNTFEGTLSRVRMGHVFINLKHRHKRKLSETEVEQVPDEKHSVFSDNAKKFLLSSRNFQKNYERLEFLGDAVLGFIVSTSLFLKYEQYGEGDLSVYRSGIVNNNTIGSLALKAGFSSLVRCAFDITQLNGDFFNGILADCFEALLGAVFIDQDLKECRELYGRILDLFDPELKSLTYLTAQQIDEMSAKYAERPVKKELLESEFVPTKEETTNLSLKNDLLSRFESFQLKSGILIRNMDLWLQVVTHKSFKDFQQVKSDRESSQSGKELVFLTKDPNYERIEFLGDSVLQLLTSVFLIHMFPYQEESLLTSARSALVNNDRLGKVAYKLGISEYIRLSPILVQNSKDSKFGVKMDAILADVFEACLGALYLEERGLKNVQKLLDECLFPLINEAIRKREWINPRNRLKHFLKEWGYQRHRKIDMTFKPISKSGPSHERIHAEALYIDNFLVSRAKATTIVEAKNQACLKALQMYGVGFPSS